MLTGGCLGKVDAARLLAMLRAAGDPDMRPADFIDAAIVDLGTPVATLATTTDLIYDFGMDPEDLGSVAVVHALSDIYACLATPVTATICLGVTSRGLDDGTSAITLASAARSLSTLGVSLGGGHTVYSERPFVAVTAIGLDALGPSLELRADTEYDLVLSKPIGSGIYIAALREGMLPKEALTEVRALIQSSNQEASASLRNLAGDDPRNVGFVTDVTGFGLLQAVQPRLRPHTRATILRSQVPTLPLVDAFVGDHGLATPLGETNMIAVHDDPTYVLDAIDMRSVLVLCDPQTSGGLIAAVRDATALPGSWTTIGRIRSSSDDSEPKVVVQ